jgi:hypothetical protein
MKYLEEHHLISDRQFGFRKGRSAGDLINVVTEQWNRSIHQSGESQVIALDISKAFDRVWHKGLLCKLRAVGLHGSLILWIENFLFCRRIQVVVDGATSAPHSLNAGVPQGSVLSPTLFLIFIDDLLSSTLNPIYSYADDSSLSSSYHLPSSSSRNDVLAERIAMKDRLKRDLITILEWGEANRVEFNPNKFQSCVFSGRTDNYSPSILISESSLTTSDTLEMLGLTISKKLSWADQINKAAIGAARCLGFLRRCKFYFTPSETLTIYKTFIRPRLEYNSHIWAGAPKTHLAALDRVQSRASRMITDVNISSTLDSLSHRRNVGALCVFYKYFHGHCSSELYELMPGLSRPVRNLRRHFHKYNLEVKFARTSKFQNSFFVRSARMWNGLSEGAFPMTYNLQRFKLNIKSRKLED